MKEIKKMLRGYDIYLDIVGRLNGQKVVIRNSPFNKLRKHEISILRNKYLGSGRWILKKLMQSDSQRKDFVYSSIRHNQKIRDSANKYDRDIAHDVAKFVKENEKVVI